MVGTAGIVLSRVDTGVSSAGVLEPCFFLSIAISLRNSKHSTFISDLLF